jgi:hypothetical protein
MSSPSLYQHIQYLPALAAAGDFPISDALKEKLKERALNRYQTRLDEAAKNKIKMYFDLFGYFSAESLILVKRHPNYLVECGQNRDADALVAIVASAHHNEIGGHIILRKHYMRN